MSGLLIVLAAFGCADNTYKTTALSNALEVSPSYIGVDQGAPQQFVATADGDPVAVTWESSDITKATVNGTGLVTTLAAGFVAITATETANTAKKKSASLTIFEVFGTPIAYGVGVTVGGATGTTALYRVFVPTGTTNLAVTLGGGTGDFDIFLHKAAPPTVSYTTVAGLHYWSAAGGNTESINAPNPGSGTWYILVDYYTGGAGATLTATKTP